MIGRITRVLSNDYTVRYDDGNEDICKARGVFRNKKISPLVGDIVEVDNNKKIITDIHKRKNELIRPPVANIDIALIVTSAKEPTFSSNLLDKMIDIIEYNNITPVICISKYDLLDDTKEIDEIINYYKSIGYSVFINTEIDKIRKIFKDTPGFSSLSFINMTKEDIRDNFIEFNEYKDECKYRDCMHVNEDECEIKRKVKENIILKSRYENYVKFIEEKER